MTTLDIQRSLLTYLYDLLTADTNLKSTMGGSVRLYPVWAATDAAFPYLVQRIDMRAREPFPFSLAVCYIDIWSGSPNANEALAIRKRIIELLDELQFATAEVANAKIRIQTDGFVPETEEGIWHYSLQFNIELYRKSETESILGR